MAMFKVEAKNKIDIDKKPRVYFTCHPDDFDKHFQKVCDDIFKTHDCAIYYTEDMTETIAEDEKEVDLGRNNLFVVPITYRLLITPNRAMDDDIPYALKNHIPVLPIMMESGIDEFYSKPDKFGELQYLNPYSTDLTEISYEEKLKKYLESVLISDELAKRVRAAFDAYIFLSYRKKDRKYANELMRLIHSNPECRDIAIWFDEFLTPGESFKENIEKILDDCELFTLLITPLLLEKVVDENGEEHDNYVISTELPLARKKKQEKGTDIFAVEMEDTDKESLSHININDYVNFKDKAFRSRLLETISRIAITGNNNPEHNFLIGLAYLDGIDVEVNREQAIKLITNAAEADLPEAMVKLISMYIDGIGVSQSKGKALMWSKKLANYYFKQVFSKKGTIKSKVKLSELFAHYKNNYWGDAIKYFLLKVDFLLPFNTIEALYEQLMSFNICEYTLLFDACKEMMQYREETQIILVTDILTKSVNGNYPPYGPLFWYVPEYGLYEVALLSLSTLKKDGLFVKMLALVRDVCWIFGHKNTTDEITTRISGKELYNTVKNDFTGIRNALCELFYTGNTSYADGDNIYPRCFNVAEAKSFMDMGCGICGVMSSPFCDELGLYSHVLYNLVDNEYIGFMAFHYNITQIEERLSQYSTKKLRGIALSPTSCTIIKSIAFNKSNVEIFYLPENIVNYEHNERQVLWWDENDWFSNSWKSGMPLTLYPNGKDKEPITYMKDFHTSMSTISDSFFSGNHGIVKKFIPNNITQIGKYAFEGCINLKHITLPPDILSLEDGLFWGCHSLECINVPAKVTKIGLAAFKDCYSLSKVTLTGPVETIDSRAFENCKNIEQFYFPTSIEKIGYNIFKGCAKLKRIYNIPNNFAKLDKNKSSDIYEYLGINKDVVIDWKTKRKSVSQNKNIKFNKIITNSSPLSTRQVKDNGLLIIEDSNPKISPDEFKNRDDIFEVVISDKISEIGDSAFENCQNLTQIYMCDSVLKMGKSIFKNCENLRQIRLSNQLTVIDEDTFYGCNSLHNIKIPNKVNYINMGAFAFCKRLTQISLPSDNISLGTDFWHWRLRNGIPEDMWWITTNGVFEGCGNLKSINLEMIDVLGDRTFCSCENLEKIVIPNGIAFIGDHTFYKCKKLVEVCIPNSVTSICTNAFEDCISLKHIIFSESLEEIVGRAFKGCLSLSRLYLPGKLKSIGIQAFENCKSLTHLSIPSSTKSIEDHAFYGCESLVSVNISRRFEGDIKRIFGNIDPRSITFF